MLESFERAEVQIFKTQRFVIGLATDKMPLTIGVRQRQRVARRNGWVSPEPSDDSVADQSPFQSLTETIGSNLPQKRDRGSKTCRRTGTVGATAADRFTDGSDGGFSVVQKPL